MYPVRCSVPNVEDCVMPPPEPRHAEPYPQDEKRQSALAKQRNIDEQRKNERERNRVRQLPSLQNYLGRRQSEGPGKLLEQIRSESWHVFYRALHGARADTPKREQARNGQNPGRSGERHARAMASWLSRLESAPRKRAETCSVGHEECIHKEGTMRVLRSEVARLARCTPDGEMYTSV